MRAERQRQRFFDASSVRVPGRAPRWIVPTVKVGLVVADAFAVAFSFIFAFTLRQGVSAFAGFAWSEQFAPYGALMFFVVGIRLLTFRYCDLYRVRGEFSFVDDGTRIFKATAIGSLLIVAAAFLYRGGFQFRAFSYARGVFVVDFVFVLLSVGTIRLFTRSVQTFVRRRQINLIPTLVVGRGHEASLFIREMRERPALGYRVIGVVDAQIGEPNQAESYEGVPVVGTLQGLPETIRDSGANEVIIADPQVNGDALFEVMMRCGRRRGVEFRIAPSLFNCLPRKTEIDQIGVLPMIRLFREPLSSGARVLKRASDLIISSLAIALLLPLWLLIALLIKLDSRGPVFYTQERVGMDGRLFLLYKFRTMVANADSELHREYQRAFIAGRAEANLGNDQKPTYKLLADPRITRVGKFLRKTSIDEVPQLWNVLMGDMSIVGPRPPIPYEVEAYELWHRKRLDMKPGLTGLWQVSGRNRLPFEEMVRLDLFYIENWSLLLDLKIIVRTGFVMLGREGY